MMHKLYTASLSYLSQLAHFDDKERELRDM